MIAQFEHASGAIIGTRTSQEDACAFALLNGQASALTGQTVAITSSNELLAVLTDGMGGHVGGAKASSLACRNFIADYSDRTGPTSERLMNALEESNKSIETEIDLDRALHGMGCTLIGATFRASGLRWVSVGDSLLYLIRGGDIYHLNEDHSLAPVLDELVLAGEMSAYEAKCHPRRNALRSALTGTTLDLIDLKDEPVPLEPDDIVVVASDGILSIAENDILKLVQDNQKLDTEELVRALLDAVEEAQDPFQDNTTIMVVRPKD